MYTMYMYMYTTFIVNFLPHIVGLFDALCRHVELYMYLYMPSLYVHTHVPVQYIYMQFTGNQDNWIPMFEWLIQM